MEIGLIVVGRLRVSGAGLYDEAWGKERFEPLWVEGGRGITTREFFCNRVTVISLGTASSHVPETHLDDSTTQSPLL